MSLTEKEFLELLENLKFKNIETLRNAHNFEIEHANKNESELNNTLFNVASLGITIMISIAGFSLIYFDFWTKLLLFSSFIFFVTSLFFGYLDRNETTKFHSKNASKALKKLTIWFEAPLFKKFDNNPKIALAKFLEVEERVKKVGTGKPGKSNTTYLKYQFRSFFVGILIITFLLFILLFN